jgi:hypothetical protein
MKPSLRPHSAVALHVVAAALAAASLGILGCSSSSGGAAGASALGAGDAGAGADTGVVGEDFVPTVADFDCVLGPEWTLVGLSRFKNALGHTAEMLDVAQSPDGGVYPVGTMIQLTTVEASVKRGAGYNAASNDWEFFTLGVSASGTKITASGGGASVKNFTGSSCLTCHSRAAPQWDFVCGDLSGGNTHGCASLPISGAELASSQNSDPRCTASVDGGDGGTEE